MKRKVVSLLAALLLLIPAMTLAAGLVPCGGPDEPVCQACYAVEMLNGVLDWLVGILSVVFALIVMTAGFNLVSSTGNTAAKEKAKSMITNAFVGFVIVLSAWLLIDYGMRFLVADPGNTVPFGTWNAVQCVEQRTTTWELTQVNLTETCQLQGPGIYDCSQQASTCTSRPDGTATYETAADGTQSINCSFNTGGANPADLSAAGGCSAGPIANYFPEQVGNAQCIIREESCCGACQVSTSDILSNEGNRAFSFGLMQINLTVHNLEGCGPGGADLRCADAFSGSDYSARIVNEELYQQCATAAQNPECNLRNGRRIYNERNGGSWGPWSTASACGVR